MTAKSRVYSYLRFSDPKPAPGGTADRQTEYVRRWAAEHEIRLDETLSQRDEGLSAYHQKHVAQGVLGVFPRAVEEGALPPGSVPIEGLDSLSRADPIFAKGQLSPIIGVGIRVIAAANGREYWRDTLSMTRCGSSIAC